MTDRTDRAVQVATFHLESTPLYAGVGQWQQRILTKESPVAEGVSQQGYREGEVPQPIDYEVAQQFRVQNSHHSACIAAKVQSTTGLGFITQKRDLTAEELTALATGATSEQELDKKREIPNPLYDVLDPLCDLSFHAVLTPVTEDFVELGTGYIEVVRSPVSDEILGLHYQPARFVHVVGESTPHQYHYSIRGDSDQLSGDDLQFARFGDRAGFRARYEIPSNIHISELIAIRQVSSRSKYYGFPDWLAATPGVELVQMHRQHNYDFFNNRGVPEFMLFVIGKKMRDADWNALKEGIRANIGQGNGYKSMAVNIDSDPETIKVQLEKLGMEGGASAEGVFKEVTDSLAMEIVSAHRTPPLLAGIMIPGKLGASNEMVNALVAFQSLVISQFQMTFVDTLRNTLGDPSKNGGLSVDPLDFEFKTIVDQFDLQKMDTVSKMRQPLPDAQNEGRDMAGGVKK